MAVTIGKAIKILREAKDRSLGNLAAQAKVSVPYLSLVESDKRTPSIDVVKKLARALEVPADVFFLIGSGPSTSLNTNSDVTSRLLVMLKQLEAFEEKIRYEVKNHKQ